MAEHVGRWWSRLTVSARPRDWPSRGRTFLQPRRQDVYIIQDQTELASPSFAQLVANMDPRFGVAGPINGDVAQHDGFCSDDVSLNGGKEL